MGIQLLWLCAEPNVIAFNPKPQQPHPQETRRHTPLTPRILNSIIAVVAVTGLAFQAMAADLIVEENGDLPNYGTIKDAVNAASDGVRIFIKNKAGGIAYQKNVIIAKS